MNDGDTFKFVSHSIGGAFARGISNYLAGQGHVIDEEVYINTYQADKIQASSSGASLIIDYKNFNDPVTNWETLVPGSHIGIPSLLSLLIILALIIWIPLKKNSNVSD